MVNYQNSKIYKLVGGGKTYIGSTTQTLAQRKAQHKCHKNCLSKEIIDLEDLDIILIEKYPCESKEELHSRERYWIENMECLNNRIPTRTNKEYREANKDILKEKKKEYTEANKDILKEKNKAYREANKDIIKERKKKYYEANKDKINEKKRAYREANKDKINAYMKAYREANKK